MDTSIRANLGESPTLGVSSAHPQVGKRCVILKDVYAARYWKVGGTWGAVIPPDLRVYLGLTPGDCMLMCVHERADGVKLLIMRRATREMILERDNPPPVPGAIPANA